VTIKVDAYPDYDFNGTHFIFSGHWLAFSILPDNATGNFVKQFNVYPKLLLMPITILKKIIASGNERGYRRTYQITALLFHYSSIIQIIIE
jgi:hypothetical protein